MSLIMVQGNYLLDTTKSQVGLVVDEWVEMIPNKQEVTGVTFNYDQPDATPAHSLLLAVPPEIKGNWTWDDLVYTLMDTLDCS